MHTKLSLVRSENALIHVVRNIFQKIGGISRVNCILKPLSKPLHVFVPRTERRRAGFDETFMGFMPVDCHN